MKSKARFPFPALIGWMNLKVKSVKRKLKRGKKKKKQQQQLTTEVGYDEFSVFSSKQTNERKPAK